MGINDDRRKIELTRSSKFWKSFTLKRDTKE